MNQAITPEHNARLCPLCAGADLGEGPLGLLRCQSCDLIVDSGVWRQRANEGFEDEWFGAEYDPEQSAWVRLFQRWNDGRTMRRLESLNRPGNRLLEVGVGSGSLLRRARTAGYDVTGCDLSAPICARIEREHGIRMHCGPVDSLPEQLRFDVIVMNHVLEHVPDPVGFVRGVRKRLSPHGVLHLAVPNVTCFEARLPGWTSYEPYHLVYFSPETLRRTVEAAGLVVERELTHESFSGWFLAAVRTALGVRHAKAGAARLAARTDRTRSPIEHAYRLAMITVGGLTWPFRAVQAALKKGDEAICIARAPDG